MEGGILEILEIEEKKERPDFPDPILRRNFHSILESVSDGDASDFTC